ncbi:hypothetical protein ARHIZOSPH14_10440 [Agromyces rhizosphaerae]|uniref:DUF998 domain-containing protein n=1 Tax=Agromyces rhizosphaerae TaxID=88374 RepID=A0A9W6CUR0_9MICO|nr:hypothetical protein [Agromyces rhizosphaerae]GLI26802.1 hypothetical protein ARHIZOSPH14_10440 [Agromyces rhizosphaerae]
MSDATRRPRILDYWRAPTAETVEASAIVAAAVAFVAAALGMLIVGGFEAIPITGWGSVAEVSAFAAAISAAIAFGIGYGVQGLPLNPAYAHRTPTWARWVDALALAFTAAVLVLLLVVGLGALLGDAFRGASLYGITAALLAGAIAAVTSYFTYLVAAGVSASSIATLLAFFLVSGCLGSMLTASDPLWWEKNLSALGTARDASGYAFGITLILGGLVVTALARYIGGELRQWSEERGLDAERGIRTITGGLVLLGIFLACVGVFPVDLFFGVHNTVATGMAVVYLVIVIGLRWFLPGFPNAFLVLGYAFIGIILVSVLMFFPFGYYNLTAVELVAAGLIFSWLIIFIRNISASTTDRRVAEVTRAVEGDPAAAPVHEYEG